MHSPKNPLLAPWPPQTDVRLVDAGPLGKWIQVREGGMLSTAPGVYRDFWSMVTALHAARPGSNN